MARPKGAKNKKHVFQDPEVEEIVEVEIDFVCPVRGKIKQKVKMKRLKKIKTEQKVFVGAQSIIDDIEAKEDDLSLQEPDPEE